MVHTGPNKRRTGLVLAAVAIGIFALSVMFIYMRV